MTDQELIYWIALKWVEGIGNVAFNTLVQTYGSPREVFDVSIDRLKKTPGISQKIAEHIKSFSQWAMIKEELNQAQKQGVSIITCRDPRYPRYLLNIYDFPPLLYVKGTLREDDIPLAVVGSRMASPYGKFSTERLCRELAMKGLVIVSGLARGIDTAAHRGCLSAKGRTIAVLGCGMDIVYPKENKELFETIAAHGAIVTEFPFGTPPHGPNFPARNRIISGISLGVVVVEANYRSGSLITARIALEQGREVFAVPGSIDAAGSKGTNKLIKDGAKLVENADDIIEELLPMIEKDSREITVRSNSATESSSGPMPEYSPRIKKDELNGRERSLLACLPANPISIDEIISRRNEKAEELLSTLLMLELKGHIRQLPGKMFIRSE